MTADYWFAAMAFAAACFDSRIANSSPMREACGRLRTRTGRECQSMLTRPARQKYAAFPEVKMPQEQGEDQRMLRSHASR